MTNTGSNSAVWSYLFPGNVRAHPKNISRTPSEAVRAITTSLSDINSINSRVRETYILKNIVSYLTTVLLQVNSMSDVVAKLS